ncbi:solute carrier family 22 member 20-like [Gastrophryne carolinensis]
MGFNDLLHMVGGFGRFQVLNTIIIFIPMFFMACHSFLQNFTAAMPAHRCHIPSLDNDFGAYNHSTIATFIPANDDPTGQSCTRFKMVEPGIWSNATTEPCDDGWVYDRSVFTSTIVTEWDLVCNMRKMRQVAQSIYMAGVLVGAFILGNLSDRFGRKTVLSGCYLLLAVSGTCAAFLPSFVAYCIFRGLCGAGFSGIAMNTISLALEWTPPNRRTTVGTTFAYSFTVGQVMLPGIAYGIRDWRWLQFTVSAPYYLFFLTSWFLPESARWLLVKGRSFQALRDLQRVARINGRKEEGEKLSEEVVVAHMQSDLCGSKPSHSLLDLFRTPGMRRITLCVMLVWFATSFSFYGLGMDLQKFGLSVFLVQFIFGCIDIPAKVVGAFLMSHVGRRVTQSASLIMAGVALLCSALLSQDMRIARMVAAGFGKACLSSSFCCAYLYATELFPTVIRQSGMGVASVNARIGSIVAPMVLLLSEFSPIFPPAIFGVTAIISGSAAAFLFETGNQKLPDIIEDVEARSKDADKYKFYQKEKVPLTHIRHSKKSVRQYPGVQVVKTACINTHLPTLKHNGTLQQRYYKDTDKGEDSINPGMESSESFPK